MSSEKQILSLYKISGEASLSGDKSLSHRYLFLAPFADRPVILKNISTGLDVRSSIVCLRKVGVRIDGEPPDVKVFPLLTDSLLNQPVQKLDCGNSGTSARFLMGFLSAFGIRATIDGDESLRKRPMKRVIEPLCGMGARIRLTDGDSLPAHIEKPDCLKRIAWEMKVPSAQVKTTILLAGLKAGGETSIRENQKTRDHTETALKAAGVDIRCKEGTIVLKPLRKPLLFPDEIMIPGDISTAAFYIVCSALLNGSGLLLRNVLLNPHRAYYLEILKKMRASIRQERETDVFGEKTGDLRIEFSGRLKGVEVGGDETVMCIDEIPALAVAASFARGKSVFRDLQELRIKESDRLKALEFNLQRLGIDARAEDDSLIIEGASTAIYINDNKTESESNVRTVLDSFGDHRIAMAMKTACLVKRSECTIKGSESAQVSAPGFYETLGNLLAERSPENIFFAGFMGAGKTTIGASLAEKLGYSFIDLDERVREAAGKPIWRIFTEDGEDRFRGLEKKELMNLAGIHKTIIALGGGTTCDRENISFICKTGIVILLTSPPDILFDRIRNEKSRPLSKKVEDFQRLLEERIEYGCYSSADIIFDSSKINPSETVSILSDILSPLL